MFEFRWETLWTFRRGSLLMPGKFPPLPKASDGPRLRTRLLFSAIKYVCRRIFKPPTAICNQGSQFGSVFILLFLLAPEEIPAEMSFQLAASVPPTREDRKFLRSTLLAALFTHHTTYDYIKLQAGDEGCTRARCDKRGGCCEDHVVCAQTHAGLLITTRGRCKLSVLPDPTDANVGAEEWRKKKKRRNNYFHPSGTLLLRESRLLQCCTDSEPTWFART